jgi:hypothetical protein
VGGEIMVKIITDAKEGKKLTEYLDTDLYKKVLLPCWHGVGDIVMFQAPLKYLKEKYPEIEIKVGLARGLQQEFIIEDAVLLDGDWRESVKDSDYDLVFSCHMPLEKLEDLSMTKAEVCCEEELGIPKTSGHLSIKVKKLVGVHFHNTSVSWLTNPDEVTAQKIWQEILEVGCIPVETLFQHVFYNETSKKFDFVDNHVRNWPARLDTLITLLHKCDYFIGVVSGNFHLALSLLPPEKICLLEKELKAPHFTKLPIKTIDIKEYKEGMIRKWLNET